MAPTPALAMDTPVHEYTATKQDFHDAQRLHRANRRWVAIGYYFWVWFVPLAGTALALIAGTFWLQGNRAGFYHLLPEAALGAYFAVVLPLLRWNQIRRLWDRAQPKKFRDQPVTLQFDAQQIISARPGSSEGRFQWTAIEDYAEDERLALLYVQRKLFLFVPKRAMDEAEWDRLRAVALTRKAAR